MGKSVIVIGDLFGIFVYSRTLFIILKGFFFASTDQFRILVSPIK